MIRFTASYPSETREGVIEKEYMSFPGMLSPAQTLDLVKTAIRAFKVPGFYVSLEIQDNEDR